MSNADIKSLILNRGFDAQIIPTLETHLVAQGDGNQPYDFDANRTLVKLYQFNPRQSKSEIYALALLLSIVYGGFVEFGALNCLIPESAKGEELFATIFQCADLLDICQFKVMWESFKSIPVNVVNSKHIQDALRRSILATLSFTFKNTQVTNLLTMLDLKSEAELKEFLKINGSTIVESVDNGTVVFSDNIENTKRAKNHQEGLGADYGALHRLVNAASE
jgi:translation initiation factor 3 subunit K